MHIFPGNAQHIGNRINQQDSFGFSDIEDRRFLIHGGVLMIVTDGMGGMIHGEEASRLAVDVMLREYMNKVAVESIFNALERSLHQANQAVLCMARDKGVETETGTTIVAAVVKDEKLYWISVGDSRLYLFRKEELTCLTRDHLFANQLAAGVRNGKISSEEAEDHPDRHALTSFLGLPELVEIERNVRPFPLEPGDAIMLCSDGLHATLSDKEIADAFTCVTPQAMAEKTVRRALEKKHPHQDNITVTILSLPEVKETGQTLENSNHKSLLIISLVIALVLGGALYWHIRPFFEPSEAAIETLSSPSESQPAPAEPEDTLSLPTESTNTDPTPDPEKSSNAEADIDPNIYNNRDWPETTDDVIHTLPIQEPREKNTGIRRGARTPVVTNPETRK